MYSYRALRRCRWPRSHLPLGVNRTTHRSYSVPGHALPLVPPGTGRVILNEGVDILDALRVYYFRHCAATRLPRAGQAGRRPQPAARTHVLGLLHIPT